MSRGFLLVEDRVWISNWWLLLVCGMVWFKDGFVCVGICLV